MSVLARALPVKVLCQEAVAENILKAGLIPTNNAESDFHYQQQGRRKNSNIVNS